MKYLFLICLVVSSCSNSDNGQNYFKDNWSYYVACGHSQYIVKKLGGISGLSVVGINKSDFSLDRMVVRVDYIQQNGRIYKTELVDVGTVYPHSQRSAPAPNSERGKSVIVSVSLVESSQIGFFYSAN